MTTPGNFNSSAPSAGMASPQPQLVFQSPLAGFSLVNGTPTIATWAVPNDGRIHRVWNAAEMTVQILMVGGAITLQGFAPDGTEFFWQLFPGGSGVGYVFNDTDQSRLVQPGSVVTINQSSALTSGAAKFWTEIWAA
jgi:hypothetical protein